MTPRTTRQRDIEGETVPWTGTNVVPHSCAGVMRPLVRAEIEDGWIIVEYPLRPIAMVYVPVDYQHPIHILVLLCMAGRQGCVVEYAEPHPPFSLSMVPRRTKCTECVPNAPLENSLDGIQSSPRCVAGDLLRRRANVGITGTEGVTPRPNIVSHKLDVFA